MLARLCRNWNHQKLLVGMENGAATMENSLVWQSFKKLPLGLPYDPPILPLGKYLKEL